MYVSDADIPLMNANVFVHTAVDLLVAIAA